jgi:N-carbamoyl-L-amino-acid hydrolase
LNPDNLHGFLELHIEQGPVLSARNIPIGVVTGIRGSLRVRDGIVLGEYAHSGAVPHYLRKDAVFAAAEFATKCEQLGEEIRINGGDVDVTFGRFSTDARADSLTKVAGELRFTIDVRSSSGTILEQCKTRLLKCAERVSAARNVSIALGQFAKTEPAAMANALIELVEDNARVLNIPSIRLPSGAGHDAVEFAHLGVPTSMIFVRNAHGSHNPDEDMAMSDFVDGVWILTAMLTR